MKSSRLILLLLFLPLGLCGQEVRYFSKQYQIPFPKSFNRPDTVEVAIIGDVMMHAKQLERDYHPFLERIAPALKAADIAVANLEFPLGGKP